MPVLLSLIAALAALAAAVLSWLALRAATAPRAAEPPHPEVFGRLAALEREVEKLPRDFRADFSGFRQELKVELAALHTSLETRIGRSEQAQGAQLAAIRGEAAQGRKHADEALGGHVDRFSATQTHRLGETNLAMKELRERTEAAVAGLNARVETFTKETGERHDALREQVRGHLDTLREGNEKKLDEMRGVVDEKLSSTLNERLDQSFKTVGERLEAVHKGLGEMAALATGVGDLKRVLTNVKARGGWGELRLAQLLEDMLTPDQYEGQVAVRAGAGERVDFAVKLPGKGEAGGPPLWLPIDAKFPQEDYERLQAAHERGAPEEVEACAAALERAVRLQAKSICAKYVHPPHTTDFAILYLPTEGLFAEVIRRPGLVSDLQSAHRVMVTGPTTLAAILNSLQMGFRSLAVEKRSSDVWKVLAEAKAEFRKYGEVWGKLGEKLDQAKGLHDSVAVRARAVERKLKGVEALEPAAESAPLLALPAVDDEVEAA